MTKVFIYVEGQTEETFVNQVLRPYFANKNVFLRAILSTTKRAKDGTKFKGGITSYVKVRNDIITLSYDSSVALITTMLDYYRLPSSFPGKNTIPNGTALQKVNYLEEEFRKDINLQIFLPFITLHEFESLLFSSPEQIASAFPRHRNLGRQLNDIRNRYTSPEDINDGPSTHPAMRIINEVPDYKKPLHGSIIASRIGLNQIRTECSHFDRWILQIESLLSI